MKTFMTPFKNIKILFLYLFPLYCIFTGAFFRTLLGDLSLRTIDPDYVYFSNGLDITLGSFDTGNIFHPGAPLQYFTASQADTRNLSGCSSTSTLSYYC